LTDQPNSRGDPLQSLIAELLPWIAEVLQGSTPARVAGPKLIRDAVHGYHLLQPYEVAILDCPIVQRLRYIHQTALAYLVYPTAHHTRFDHSLGMAAVAEKMVKRRLENVPGVGAVNLVGESEREIQVVVDRSRLEAYHVSLADVVNAAGIIWVVAVLLFMLVLAALSHTAEPKTEDDISARWERRG